MAWGVISGHEGYGFSFTGICVYPSLQMSDTLRTEERIMFGPAYERRLRAR